MKRKSLITILAVVLTLVLSLAIAACSNNKHEYSSEWKFDETSHWHECTTEKHTDTTEKLAHDFFNEGEVTTQPTEEAEGVKTYTCQTCGQTKTEPVEKLPHTHKFNTDVWEKDATNHWHPATCGHKDEKQDVTPHNWNNGEVTTQPTEEAEGVKTYTCQTCGQTKTELVEKLPHTHKYDTTAWVKTDESGHYRPTTAGTRTKPKILRSIHTRMTTISIATFAVI